MLRVVIVLIAVWMEPYSHCLNSCLLRDFKAPAGIAAMRRALAGVQTTRLLAL